MRLLLELEWQEICAGIHLLVPIGSEWTKVNVYGKVYLISIQGEDGWIDGDKHEFRYGTLGLAKYEVEKRLGIKWE